MIEQPDSYRAGEAAVTATAIDRLYQLRDGHALRLGDVLQRFPERGFE